MSLVKEKMSARVFCEERSIISVRRVSMCVSDRLVSHTEQILIQGEFAQLECQSCLYLTFLESKIMKIKDISDTEVFSLPKGIILEFIRTTCLRTEHYTVHIAISVFILKTINIIGIQIRLH